ncbi:MAG: haloacid dehalogenase-like hydrolase [Aureliella sp.]
MPSDEKDVQDVIRQMELDRKLPEAIQRLNQAGWRVVVASAGCDWYIGQLLNEAGVDVQVYANPGHFDAGKGLLMRMPADASIASPTLGVDKTRIVRSFLERGLTVAFAGDGLPDSEPVRLVPARESGVDTSSALSATPR